MSKIMCVENQSHGPDGPSLFEKQVKAFTHDLALIEKEIDGSFVPEYEDSIHRRLLDAVEVSVDACRGFEASCGDDRELLRVVQSEFRRTTEPWFSQCWIANRARSKPSGFAGDYEMLVKLYERKTPATGIGIYLDMICMDLPLACAVRGRLEMIRRFLLQEVSSRGAVDPVRILDIASGPCREYFDWPSRTHAIEALAMDSDPPAVEYVNSIVAPRVTSPSRLESIQYNAFRTRSSEATIKKFGRFDIIYSVGLCDYLTDDVLIKLLSAWYETLAENGVLFVAFKDTRRYDQTIYQWHLDWFFYQRTVQDVFELYDKAGFDLGNIETCRDETGVITGFVTRRDPSRQLRIDTAETVVRKPTLRLFNNRPVVIPSAPTTEGMPAT
jgi:extracellular factor (EF) 3-hydroxypalmitic acid methyl ester biosynthesis protein